MPCSGRVRKPDVVKLPHGLPPARRRGYHRARHLQEKTAPMFTTRPEILGTFGVVASTHWLASSAGMGMQGYAVGR